MKIKIKKYILFNKNKINNHHHKNAAMTADKNGSKKSNTISKMDEKNQIPFHFYAYLVYQHMYEKATQRCKRKM